MRRAESILLPGRPERPACLFIHGLGMDYRCWTDPTSARMLGGLFALPRLIRGESASETLFHDLHRAGCTVAAWTQPRPMGPSEVAIGSLRKALRELVGVPHRGLILVGHSRGGLVARAYVEQEGPATALVTLGSPHHGSGMARWVAYLRPLASALRPLVPREKQGVLSVALRRSVDFFHSPAVHDLLPDSAFLAGLSGRKPSKLFALSVAGTEPSLIHVPGLLSLPGSIEGLLPRGTLPEEMTAGRGDGLVSAASALLPWADEHVAFPVNHAELLTDPSVRAAVTDRLRLFLA